MTELTQENKDYIKEYNGHEFYMPLLFEDVVMVEGEFYYEDGVKKPFTNELIEDVKECHHQDFMAEFGWMLQ